LRPQIRMNAFGPEGFLFTPGTKSWTEA